MSGAKALRFVSSEQVRARSASMCVWAASALWLGACGGRASEEETLAKARARGAVVAKVNGATIGVEQVREVARSTGLSPRETLLRLEEEQLLAEEALRRGYGRGGVLQQDVKRALVQAFLASTVEQVRAETIPLGEVRERFETVARRTGLALSAFAEHESAVREQLLLEKKKQLLEKLTRELRDGIGVKLSEPAVQKLLGDASLWGESS